MRRILVVGAGYSGLSLAHMLLSAGYDVTVMTAKSSAEIRRGPTATFSMTYPEVLDLERESQLFFEPWEEAPAVGGIHFSLRAPGAESMEFGGYNAAGAGRSVESRLKMADWLESFEDRGGKVVIHGCTVSDLEYFTRMFDLVVVAVGAGELGELFHHDPTRSGGAHAGRLTQASLFDVEPHPDPAVRARKLEVVSVPGAGNIFLVPQLTVHGPATLVFAKGQLGEQLAWDERPGRPSDTPAQISQQRVEVLMRQLQQYAPDLAERCRRATLVDPNAVIMEEIQPQVRHPVATVGQGMVLGMSDAVITTDPISGQANTNAALCAQTYFEAIHAHGDRPFTPEWGRAAFSTFWETWGQYNALFTDVFVANFWDESHRPPHFPELMEAVLTLPEIQDAWVTGVCKPTELMWMLDEQECRARIAQARERAEQV